MLIEEQKENPVEPRVEDTHLVVESSGRYTIHLEGVMVPGEVWVNGEMILTLYLAEGSDATLLLYLLKGDTVTVTGATPSIRKVEYTQNA